MLSKNMETFLCCDKEWEEAGTVPVSYTHLIQVPPQRGDLVETRIIDGVGYILIRAEGGVEVNGVPVRFSPEES